MLRAKWEFEYTAKNLAMAAEAQKTFRASRVKVWEGKKEEVIAKIKDSGLNVHQSIAESLNFASNNVNALKYSTQHMQGPQITIDATMQRDLDECFAKIQEHTDLRKQYDAWQQVLEGNAESRVKLDHDDWMFFFGK